MTQRTLPVLKIPTPQWLTSHNAARWQVSGVSGCYPLYDGAPVPTRAPLDPPPRRSIDHPSYPAATQVDDALYRAIDQFGQVIDVLVSEKRDLAATRRFFTRALGQAPRPAEVTTDRAQAYPRALDELLPATCHVMTKYANNPIESDHSRLKSRLRPMRASNSSAARG